MGRKRKTNKHLPQRVYLDHGAYFYKPLNGRKIHLGRKLAQALAKYGQIREAPQNITTIGALLDRYMTEVAPLKAPKTYKDNLQQANFLRAYFGTMKPEDVRPTDVYEYLAIRSKSPVAANREKSLLSHLYTMAIRWGIVTDNPCRNVKRNSEKRRSRYITDEEFDIACQHASPLIRAAMKLAYYTGLRRGDVLGIKLEDITEEGLKKFTSKTEKKLTFALLPKLSAVIEEAKSINLNEDSSRVYLFESRLGQPYTRDGFSSIWQRFMEQLLERKLLTRKFTFRDIRRKSATDAEEKGGREYARQLLGHQTQQTTERYIDGYQKVKPLD